MKQHAYSILVIGIFSTAIMFSGASSVRAYQEFYVDFDTSLGLAEDDPGKPIEAWRYAYDATGQRDMIIANLNDNFDAYDMKFFEGLPLIPGAGSVITLNSASFGGGSEGVDFRNIDGDDGAVINVLSILEFLGEDLSAPTYSDSDVAFATANLIGHEAGHLMGARHHDAHGPLGTGIGAGTSPSDFSPPYVGPSGAPETPFAFMGVHAGGGNFSFAGLYSPNFVSERTVVKLQFAKSEGDDFIISELGGNNLPKDAQFIEPEAFAAPYPIRPMIDPEDLPSGEEPPTLPDLLTGGGNVILGTLDTPAAGPAGDAGMLLPDYYSFLGTAGQIVTIEVMSYLLPADGTEKFRYADNADVAVALLDPDLLPVIGGLNDDDDDTPPFGSPKFLGGATLLDVELPVTGLYTIEVLVATDLFPVPESGKPGTDGGSYELLIYTATPVPEPGTATLALLAMMGLLGCRRPRPFGAGCE